MIRHLQESHLRRVLPQVRRPPFCWFASQSDKATGFSFDRLVPAGAFLAAFAVGASCGSAASRASRNAFSLAILSSTALELASRSALPDLASFAALAPLSARAWVRSRSSFVISGQPFL